MSRRALATACVAAAALWAAACGEKTPALAPLDASAVVLAFGDSLTFGTGAGDGESYPAQLERLIGRKVVAQGVPGEVTAQGLARDKGIAVVLIGVPKPGISPAPAAFYAEIAREFALPYEGAVLKAVLTDNALKSDWVHPNAQGYARIAAAMAALLKKARAIQ